MSKSLLKAISQGTFNPPVPHCQRCKHPCKVVNDYLEDFRGRVPFEESDCCGAPVNYTEEKKDDTTK